MALMQTKVTDFSFNSADVPFKSSKVNKSVKMIDVTDNSSTGDSVEKQAGRETYEVELTGVILKSAVKQIGKACKLTFNSIDYKTTACSFEEAFQEVDVTNGSSAGNSSEFDVGFAERKFTAECWQEDTVVDPPLGTAYAATVLFATGVSVASTVAVIESVNVDGEVKGDQKLSISGSLSGTVTQTSVGLTSGTSATATMTLATGTATNKAYTGTAVLLKKKVSTTIDGDVAVTYTFKFSGALTESVKANT
jgi:hypothetical protein